MQSVLLNNYQIVKLSLHLPIMHKHPG